MWRWCRDNPEIVYAALYGRRRTPWSFAYGTSATNGEDVGGIFKEHKWRRRVGKNAATVCRHRREESGSRLRADESQDRDGGDPERRKADRMSFTDIHSKRGGVFRSEDGGENWKRTSDLDPRPFYFSQIRIDPANDQRVYLLGVCAPCF